MAPSDYATYRVQGLPSGIDADDAEQLLKEFFDLDGLSTKPEVHSLGLDPFSFDSNMKRVATVTFANTPEALRDGDHWEFKKRVSVKGTTTDTKLEIDTTFRGFTPLNLVKDDVEHKIDCIVVSGLSSHPFGSWKQRGGSFMWLRDDAAWRSPNVRTLLYGYETPLVRSESFQDIDEIGCKLGDFITRIRTHRVGEIDFKPRPIVFIAHSLGGLVVKENDEINARCVYGFVFFGVPNRGIYISHWLPMVDNQPNESLVRNLAPESHYLRNLHRRFSDHSHMPMNQNHADLPKFRSTHDSDYQLLIMYLNEFWREAVHDVEMRFGVEGMQL
ncbi:hypothetical protein Micbo1qcDRAFT_219001 [Microdochium bolleyi]|uniref:DUF676 domain-containing protein n=1 Tax=Microdochium bolleyi TaxID=196109 RepID=A0A136INI3_9PEZI|nr:hypothetical protein Micbo1qcDRAFT_219001 [Microdochium bolleyi]